MLLIVILAASLAAFVVGIARATKSAEPYRVGLSAAQQDARVIAALGAPIEDGVIPSGSVSINGGSGNANFSVSLHGARGNGTLYIEADRHAGRWHYTTLQVVPDASAAIALLANQEAGTGAARSSDAVPGPGREASGRAGPGAKRNR
ncbi:cytochrome c oxidase assembly factor Coa1 family protein [Xanthomonas codiaei]|uniref:cytochrome c oxidase assembly factor Coa1 family protein n=1 Tax=Xanthomonas codiaei TaxID=56463 RepID=UPI001FC96FF0|nr:cytochrome c oxidase assembly factor Coa1 family protein [Xanthomonas codiaei]